MVYDVPTLISAVRVALDMNRVEDNLIADADEDTLGLDDIIRSKLEPAARIVETNAPRHLIDEGKAFAGTIGWPVGAVGKGEGYVLLPDDFMRLVAFQMSDWKYPVSEALSDQSVEYAMQQSRFPGVAGNPERPVVAVVHRPAGLTLEFYKCEAGDGVYLRTARYLPFPKIVSNSIELCPKLREAVVAHAAYMTALTLGNADQAQALMAMGESLMA